jgi:CheY-like chemotaxis protein
VEDEQIVALEMAASLAELGCEVIGPAGTLEEGLRLAVSEGSGLDAAVLDVNLQGRASFPIADVLSGFGVPIVYATGYSSMPPGRSSDASPLLSKPLQPGQLAATLRHALASGQAPASPRPERVGSGGRTMAGRS